MDSPEMEQNIARLLELKPLAKEYEELDKAIKNPLKEQGVLNAVIGSKYQIVGRKTKRTSYDANLLDDETKKSIAKETEYITYKIADLEAK